MAMTQRSTVVGVFEHRAAADAALRDLQAAGFTRDRVGIAMRHADHPTDAAEDEGANVGSGAVTGVLAGAGLGALAGFGVLSGMIPIIGPAIAGGTLGIILSNAAAGAGVAGLVGALIGAGLPEEEAHFYQGEFEAGRTIVTIHADNRGEEAAAILRRHGAFDMQNRPEGMTTGRRPSAASLGEAGIDLSGMGVRTDTGARETGDPADPSREWADRKDAILEPHGPGVLGATSPVDPDSTIRIPVRDDQVNPARTPRAGR